MTSTERPDVAGEPERRCYICGEPIAECMGFTRSDDFVAFLQGKRTEMPREACGKCGVRLMLAADAVEPSNE